MEFLHPRCPTQLLPWIQNQDLKKLIAFEIGMILTAGKLARILSDFLFDFSMFSLSLLGIAVLVSYKKWRSSTTDVRDTGASTSEPMAWLYFIRHILRYRKLPCLLW